VDVTVGGADDDWLGDWEVVGDAVRTNDPA
jgi:hypothetical protein